MTDDLGFSDIGCYGSEYFETPRLDELARTGIRFNYCYSEPVCTSSRVKIMTGRDGIRNYVAFGVLDPKEITFGTMMKKAGYATAVWGEPHATEAMDDGTLLIWRDYAGVYSGTVMPVVICERQLAVDANGSIDGWRWRGDACESLHRDRDSEHPLQARRR